MSSLSIEDEIPLEDGIRNAVTCLNMFFSNQIEESKTYMEQMKNKSFYHRGALCYHSTAIAIFTMEAHHIDEAIKICHETLEVIQQKRKPHGIIQSVSNLFSKIDYETYTDEQCHAEMGNAEFNFMLMCLYVISEQSFLSALVRGTRCLYNSYTSMKLCYEIFKNKKQWPTGHFVRRNFECGVHFTWGLINMVLARTPSRWLRLVSLIGLDADLQSSLKHVHIATDEMTDCLRSRLASFMICLYEFYREQFFGLGEADLEWVKRLTNYGLQRFPDSAFDLFFAARSKQLSGDTRMALQLYERSIAVQSQFAAMHNVSRWEMIWCYSMQGDWQKAAELAQILQETAKWSPATNAYQYTCFNLMAIENDPNKENELRHVVDKAMDMVPRLRSRYAGKTVPPEKFAITMAMRYNEGEKDLPLPAMMLFYIWNIFGNCKEHPEIMLPHLDVIDAKLRTATNINNRAVLLLLKGVCLRNACRADEAIDCFIEIVQNQDQIETDTYLPPHACLELGLTYIELHQLEQAKRWLIKARDNYSQQKFLIESQVHLRIHGELLKLKQIKKREQKSSNSSA